MILGLIPAKGTSRRLPGKNKLMFCGKPLVAWTIEAALKAGSLDEVAVSTDDPDIADIAEECGAAVLDRPAWLADDKATIYDVVRYHMKRLASAFDTAIVILQPTSPLRTADDIDECVRKWLVDIPRQSCAAGGTKANGAIYMALASEFADRGFNFDTDERVMRFEMPASRSIDINTVEDFEKAGAAMRMTSVDTVYPGGHITATEVKKREKELFSRPSSVW